MPTFIPTHKLDALVRAQVDDRIVPGVAIAIAKNGRTIYTNSVGLRNLSTRKPMLMTTPQNIDSIKRDAGESQ